MKNSHLKTTPPKLKIGLQVCLLLSLLIGIGSCSVQQVINDGVQIARSRNPAKVAEALARSRVNSKKIGYATNPKQVAADIKKMKRQFRRLLASLGVKVSGKWGKKETKLPSRTKYVKYTQNYKSRIMIDFDNGTITIETLAETNPNSSLKNAIITTLLTPEDPRSVDLFTDKKIQLTGKPYLQGLVKDERGKNINGIKTATRYAEYLVANRSSTRNININNKMKRVTYTRIRMVNNFQNLNAKRYAPLAAKYAKKFHVSKSLILAVMKTESNFNPYAVSGAPAYGLMQLVPTSGGREAYRRAKGKDWIPTRKYLFVPENNIELGAKYISTLEEVYFKKVGNPVSREYCAISGYNTGSGNVLKAFDKNRKTAMNKINKMRPPQVFNQLKNHLPYTETRKYLQKVVRNRRQFIRM